MMERGLTRCLFTVIAGASGVATAAAIASLPPGTGHESPATLARAVFVSPLFWLVLPVAFFALATALYVTCVSVSERYSVPLDAGRQVVQPLGWGLSLPVLALLIDPWSFSSSSFVLGFAGLALGALAAWRRYQNLRFEATEAMPGDGEPLEQPPGDQSGRAPATPRGEPQTAPLWEHLPSMRIVIALVAVAIPTFLAVMGPSWWPALSGDEPHYLLYAQSIWSDRDIDLGADYTDGAYRSFYPRDLSPHTKPGFDPATRYSTHGIGTALLLVPWYAVGGGLPSGSFTVLVRFAMALWLGAFALVLFELLRDIAGIDAARRGTLLAALTGPLIFVAPHLFPDLPALTLSAAAYLILRRRPGLLGALASGLLIGMLPWLGVKFFAMAAALVVVGSMMLLRSAAKSMSRTAGFLVPIVASVVAHMSFTWMLYRRLSPLALYHGGSSTGLRPVGQGESLWVYLLDIDGALRTAVGLMLDQKHGLLMIAPQYLLAVVGFAWLWRRRRADFWALIAIFLAHWGAHAVSQEMGGWSTSARPMVGALWTLAIPLGVALARRPTMDRAGTFFAGTRAALVAAGVSFTALLLAQPHLLYHDFGIHYSLMLMRYGAPGLPLWGLFPLWVQFEEPQWLASFLWLVMTVVMGALLLRSTRDVDPGESSPEQNSGDGSRQRAIAYRAAQLVFASLAAVILLCGSIMPLTQLHRPHDYGDVTVWTAASVAEEAWAEPDGVWVRGDSGVLLSVSSGRPIGSITVEVSALEQVDATVHLGRDKGGGLVRPGSPIILELEPRSGRRWQGQEFYLLGVDASGGVSPADLGFDPEDLRLLGLYLRILDVEFMR